MPNWYIIFQFCSCLKNISHQIFVKFKIRFKFVRYSLAKICRPLLARLNITLRIFGAKLLT